MKYKLLALISFIVLSSACQTTKEKSEIKVIDSEAFKALLENNSVQLVDVRTVAEFKENHINGAENVVFDNDFASKLEKLDKDKPIAVYCRSGRRSGASAKILEANGFSEIYDLEGGILQWMKDGHGVQ